MEGNTLHTSTSNISTEGLKFVENTLKVDFNAKMDIHEYLDHNTHFHVLINEFQKCLHQIKLLFYFPFLFPQSFLKPVCKLLKCLTPC